MDIYHYDENMIFIGESVAKESPLEKGVFIIPAYSTTAKPLKHKSGFIIKFNQEAQVFEYSLMESKTEEYTARPLPRGVSQK